MVEIPPQLWGNIHNFEEKTSEKIFPQITQMPQIRNRGQNRIALSILFFICVNLRHLRKKI